MISVYKFLDYRLYLKDFLEDKRSSKAGYSLRVLSNKCGFKARDYILRLINGQRNLAKPGIFKICRGLGLSGSEAEYFEDLVSFNQAKSTSEKEHYYARISSIRKHGKTQQLRGEQFDLLSKWHYSVIRSLLPVIDFKDDFSALGRFLEPPISASEAKNSVELLLKLGLLNKNKSGKYSVSSQSVTTGDELKNLALTLFHKSMLNMAEHSIDNHPSVNRDISGVTMSVSSEGFERIKSEIRHFRKKIMAIASEDSQEDRVIQLGIQCFPLSKIGRPV